MIGGAFSAGATLVEEVPKAATGFVVLFCRIGGCMLMAPGMSSSMIPVQVRLYVAMATTLALAPTLLALIPVGSLTDDPLNFTRVAVTESLIGACIGLLGRLFFVALETVTVGVTTMLGLSNPFGVQVEPNEALPPLTTLISISATSLIFVCDLHWEVLQGIMDSYSVMPVGSSFSAGAALRELSDACVTGFKLSLRVASPFYIFAVVVNLAMSLINRLTPQISIFFISSPFIVFGGIVLLYSTVRPLLEAFTAGFATALVGR